MNPFACTKLVCIKNEMIKPGFIERRKLIDVLSVLCAAWLYAFCVKALLTRFPDLDFTGVFHPWIGISFAILLLGLRRFLPGVLLGTLVVHVVTVDEFASGILFGICATFSVMAAAWLLLRSERFNRNLHSLRDYLRLLLFGCLVCSLGNAVLRAVSMLVMGKLPPDKIFDYAQMWWMGDALGIVLLAPAVLVSRPGALAHGNRRGWTEAVLLLGLSFVLGQIVFLDWLSEHIMLMSIGYWMFLIMAVIAVRMGRRGAVAASIIASVQAFYGIYIGSSMFAGEAYGTRIFDTWLYLMILAIVCMSLATYVDERLSGEEALRQNEQLLGSILDNLPFGVFVINRDGEVERSNPAGRALLARARRISDEKHREYQFRRYDTGELMEPGKWAASRALRNGETTMDEELVTETVDGERMVTLNLAFPLRNPDGSIRAAITMTRDITDIKREQEMLRGESLQTLAQRDRALKEITQGVIIANPDQRITYVNDAFVSYTGFSREEAIGQRCSILHGPETSRETIKRITTLLQASLPFQGEILNYRKDGSTFWNDLSVTPVFNDAGDLVQWVGVQRDVTARKQAEARIERLNHLYAALSHCNNAIVHCATRQELFERICEGAVRFGGMQMAWIGLLDDSKISVQPAAWYGTGIEYLKEMSVSLEGNEGQAFSFTASALIGNQPVWCQDFRGTPSLASWHEAADHHGFRAMAALPLCANGQLVGNFTLYAGVVDAFDEEARNLLLEMAQDIGFALENFERKSGLEIAAQVFAQSKEAISISDARQNILMINKAFTEITGFAEDEVLGRSVFESYAKPTSDDMLRTIRTELEINGRWKGDLWARKKGGERYLACLSVRRTYDESGNHLHSIATFTDITQARKDEEQIRLAANVFAQSSEAIIVADAARNIVMVNRAFTEMTGYDESEVLGKDTRTLYTGLRSEEIFQNILTMLARHEHWQGEIWNYRKSGELYLEWLSVSTVRDMDGKLTHYVGTSTDITQRKQDEERIHWLAHFDSLTGLPNRALLEDRCRQAISMVQGRGESLALMFVDLDHFKNINDTIGHRTGDLLLVELANRLSLIVREQDTLSRFGGDDFVLVLPGVNADQAAHIAEKIRQAIARPAQIDTHELNVQSSIGIAMYPEDGSDFDTLLKSADLAMHRAKADGRDSICFFTTEIQTVSMRALQLENALRRALEREQLALHYQPQVSIGEGRVVGAEALLRWHHPELGMISPAEFIPIAENSGMILPIGEWVMRTATRQMKSWIDSGYPPLTVSVNLSAVQLRHPRLVELVVDVLNASGLSAEFLEFELTESVAMQNPVAAAEVMEDLHRLGVRISIDDFGTGYSSLAHLKRFRAYKLKIDRSFVRDIISDSEDKAIVSAVINLANSLGMKTIAEGVETKEQLSVLEEQGCDEIQGYYYSRPLPPAEFEDMLRMGRTLQ